MNSKVDEKMDNFYNLIRCNHEVQHWIYSVDKELLSGPENQKSLETIFDESGCLDYMLEYGKNHSSPLILSVTLGLIWAADFEKELDQLLRVHVMGPAKVSEVSPDLIEKILRKQDIPIRWYKEMVKEINELPIIASSQFFQYAIMQHYCLTGVRLSISNLHYQQREFSNVEQLEPNEKKIEKTRIWLSRNYYTWYEQEILIIEHH